jgi:hypothetical protein
MIIIAFAIASVSPNPIFGGSANAFPHLKFQHKRLVLGANSKDAIRVEVGGTHLERP